MSSAPPRPEIFLYSVRQRDRLRGAVEGAGYRCLAVRRGEHSEARFASSGASVALVDLSGAGAGDGDAAAALGRAAERLGAALFALVEAGGEDAAIAAGATHLLTAPSTPETLARSLHLAVRHAERVRARRGLAPLAPLPAEPSWRWEEGSRTIDLSPALARQAGFGSEEGRRVPLIELFRKMDAEGRKSVRSAVDRLQRTGEATSFAHGVGGERMAHHIAPSPSGAVSAWVERLGEDQGRDLEADLAKALGRDEIGIVFQPQLAVTDGTVVGVEALARWRHPELGEFDTTLLFKLAERSGLLLRLSRHVQEKALAEVAAWPPALGSLRVAINVTAADIGEADFAENFLAMLEARAIDLGRVTVEITESGLIEDLASAAALLASLRASGLRVAIDDFGTGYSSLAYLKALPLDYLKIDKNMAGEIEGSARDRVVVRSIIDMARALGLSVVAEGVETEHQLALLAAEGCNYYQGYLAAPPLGSAALAAFVGERLGEDLRQAL